MFKEIKKSQITKKEKIFCIRWSQKKETKFVTDQEKADALANHFEKIHKLTHNSVSIMESIVNKTYDSYNTSDPIVEFNEILPASFKDAPNVNNNTASNGLNEIFMSSRELSEIMKTRNGKKSSGNDRTSNFMMKKMPHNFISTLAIIMNHIINMHYIPSAWKLGVITAISKANRDNTLIAKSGSGKFITEVIKGLNKRMPTKAVLLDFQAVFDTLWHKALICKMHTMKFDKDIICFVKNYLSNRSSSSKSMNASLNQNKL